MDTDKNLDTSHDTNTDIVCVQNKIGTTVV